MQVRDVIEEKGKRLFTLESDATVEDAIDMMTEKDTNAIIVYEKDRAVGILTERDVLRCYVSFGKRSFREIHLKDAMTRRLIVAKPEDDLTSTISMMTQTDIRHLPVVEEGKISVMLHICDLVQHQVGTLSKEIRYLEDYLSDLQHGLVD